VRVIDEAGKQLGVMDTRDASAEARKRGYDLALVAEKIDPPVCRFINYGQFKYKQKKLEQKQKQKNKRVEVKGIRLTFTMADNDLKIRQKQAEKFLKQGHRVKIEIILRGRENIFRNLALDKLNNFNRGITIAHVLERSLKREGRGFNIMVRPEEK